MIFEKLFMLMFLSLLILLFLLSKKSHNGLMFLLNVEVIMVVTSLIAFFSLNIFFLIVLLVGVLEAIFGLVLLINFSRLYGNDLVSNF